jgi:hypothetical protein
MHACTAINRSVSPRGACACTSPVGCPPPLQVRRIISAAINGNARQATSATHAAQVESCLRLLVRPPPAAPERSGEPAGPDDAADDDDDDESGGGGGGGQPSLRARARAAGAACEWLDCAFSAGGEQEYLPQLEIRTPERQRGDAADRTGGAAAAAAAAELCGAFRGGGGQRPSIQFVCASSFDIGKLVRRKGRALPHQRSLHPPAARSRARPLFCPSHGAALLPHLHGGLTPLITEARTQGRQMTRAPSPVATGADGRPMAVIPGMAHAGWDAPGRIALGCCRRR